MRRLIKGYPTILHGDNRNTQVRQPGITLYLFRHQPTTPRDTALSVQCNKILQNTAQYYAGLTQL